MLPLPPSCFDKFLPLLPSARRGLERRRRKTKEEELMQDIDEMMDIILPLCLSRPNVYFHLSEILSKWIVTLEQNDDDEKDLETTLSSSIQSYKDDDDDNDDDDSSINSMLSSDNSRRYSINFHSPQFDEEKDLYSKSLESLKLIRQEQSLKQLPSTTAPTNTVEEVRLDTQFLQREVYTVAADKCTRRISDIIYNLIKQFESDIENYNSIQHNNDRRFQKEWNNEQDLLLRLLDYLEARIDLVKQYHKTENDVAYPYAHVYNAVLNHYLAHTRTSSSEDEQSHHYRWKRPERPTSETRRKDVEMIEEMISMITSQEKENIDAASVRVIEILNSLREYCITEVQQLIQIENRALKRFNYALSYEEKDRLFSSQVLVDIDF